MTVNNNESNGHGGGICIKNTVGSMYTNNFDNGIILYKNKMNMIINNIICNDNTSTVYGGGMYYSDNYNTIIKNSIFKGNTTYGAGGGLFIIGNQDVLFDKAYYSYNDFHSTNNIYFNTTNEEYNIATSKGYHNLDKDRYISNIKLSGARGKRGGRTDTHRWSLGPECRPQFSAVSIELCGDCSFCIPVR